jgi:hypothetical protein
MLIFSILAVAMLSLTSTSIFSQLNTSSTTNAIYIAKSGYNYLASVYKNTTTEALKNDALENHLHNINFQLLNNKGSFLLNVEPYYFRATTSDNDLRSGNSFSFKFPGAETYKFIVNQTGTMAVYMGTTSGTYGFFNYRITAAATNNYTLILTTRPKNAITPANNLTTAVAGTAGGGGTSIVPVVLTTASAQTLAKDGNLNVAAGTCNIFPARFGFFEIPGVLTLSSYVFYYDQCTPGTPDTFYKIRDANRPNTAFYSTTNNIPANTSIYAHTAAVVNSTGTFNPGGSFTTKNTFSRTAILGYTPGGNSDKAPHCINGVPQGFTSCAVENGTCTFTGTRRVAYGANCYYNYRYTTSLNTCPGGSYCCDNNTFGDPLVGTVKACYYQ